jgi:RNA polymerase sigma-70 factor (ECF subfamily)
MSAPDPTPPPACRGFHTTRWSLVRTAGGKDGVEGRAAALEELCAAYWSPLYGFLRRRGHGAEEAADLTQGLFAELLEREAIARVNPDGGRFRTWLLGALRNHVGTERARAGADKRGGGRRPRSFDAELAESRYRLEPADERLPERTFERRWAMTVLERALGKLREEYEARGQGARFDALKGVLVEEADARSYPERAAELGIGAGALRVAVHRLRSRYRELLELEVADTLMEGEDVADELRRVLGALGRESG